MGGGPGGVVVLWSEVGTAFLGQISAQGLGASGPGGDVEVSGLRFLYFGGTVDVSAQNGMDGEIYFRGGGLPWPELLATTAVSAAMLFAASRNLARQDF